MLNYVWSFLILTGLVAGAIFGRLGLVVSSVFDVCKAVVIDIALPLAGTMMLWLGILRVMEKAGLTEVMARLLSPILRRLFPEVPVNHPAMGAMTMNIAANMLGLGNSATPLGLKAMGHLQELNPNKQSASNAMCMFLAMNTAGFTLIPMSAINYLNAGGIKNPYVVIAPTLIATTIATLVGIMAVKLLQGLPMFRVTPDEVETVDHNGDTVVKKFQLTLFRKLLIGIAALGFVAGAWFEFAPKSRDAFLESTGLQTVLDASVAKKKMAEERKAEMKQQVVAATVPAPTGEFKLTTFLREKMMTISALAIPIILIVTVLWGLAYGVPVYEEMVEGAKEGFGVATRIMPFLVVMLTGLTIFRESGAMLFLEYALRPVLDLIQMPVELLPLAMMRPLSGSGSSGILNEIILNPSSSDFLRYTAATMFGSTETTFYVLAVYFGSVAVRKSRHAVAVGLIADVAGMGTALFLGRLLFA
ncbi:hypothetical protein BH11VER1_BH11VER1_27590 [soil metagenome]